MKILAIVGSLRKDSYNRQLAEAAGEILKGQVDFEILDYSDVPLFNEDIEMPEPESIKRVRKKVEEADALWFFTPEYNRSYPGVIKNLIDWLSRPLPEKRTLLLPYKPVAISGITKGMTGTLLSQNNLYSLLNYLNMRVMNAPRLTIANATEQMDENDRVKLTKSHKYLEKQGYAFVDFIKSTM